MLTHRNGRKVIFHTSSENSSSERKIRILLIHESKMTSTDNATMEIDKIEVKMEVQEEPEPTIDINPIDNNPVEKPEDAPENQAVKMEVEEKPLEIKPDIEDAIEENKTLNIKVVQQEEGIARLSIEDEVEDTDDDEDYVVMSQEEIHSYLQEKVMGYIKDPATNKLLEYNKRSLELQEEIKEKSEEYVKLNKLFDVIYRNQEKFLRKMGVLPKIPSTSVEISVDLPALPNAIPGRPQESLLKKDLTITKIPMTPPATPQQSADKSKKSPKSSTGDIECIDLTDEKESASKMTPKALPNVSSSMQKISMIRHPAPLPPKPYAFPNKDLPPIPPKPRLKISAEDRGIVLQWDMPPCIPVSAAYSELGTFDIFGYQEQKNIPITTLLWKKIGSVKAMTLPMACTLTQFVEGNKYHFSIRAVDIHSRCGSYSDPISIVYKQKKK